MSIAFDVDDVAPANTPLPLTSLTAVLGKPGIDSNARRVGASSLLAHAVPESIVEKGSFGHPLATAVHVAFARHYPLTLTPDAIWTTIAQGFALHIRLNAETLRGQFVEHQGRKELAIAVCCVPPAADGWATVVESWCQQIRAHIGSGTADFFLNSFTTSGPIERTVSEIVMMDAFERYFDYTMTCICGIPRVELTGTVDDWREIRRRIELMTGYGVDDWVTRLRDIGDRTHYTQATWQSRSLKSTPTSSVANRSVTRRQWTIAYARWRRSCVSPARTSSSSGGSATSPPHSPTGDPSRVDPAPGTIPTR